MPDPRDDLRSTAESIRRDADQVRALEEEKLDLDPTDPKVVRLSERIERLTGGLHAKAAAERELGEQIQGTG